MNWLLVLTVLFVAANIVWGFYRGFLRVLYSMVAWIVILVAVSWLSPYVANYLTEHTRLDTYIEEGCNQKLHEWADAKKQEDKKEVKERGNDTGMPEIILEKHIQIHGNYFLQGIFTSCGQCSTVIFEQHICRKTDGTGLRIYLHGRVGKLRL